MERYCINPDCPCPLNFEGVNKCQECNTLLLIKNRYWLVEQFGDKQIFKAEDCYPGTTERWKVIKVVKATYSEEVDRLKREADILRSLSLKQYGGIPRVEDECFPIETCDPPQQLYCLVMEFIDGQNLDQWLSSQGNLIYEERARYWLKEIAEILEWVHGADIVHRDINPLNIMLRNGHLVLIDFGIATVEGRGLNGKGIGTRGYMAPEQEQEGGRICRQTDFYALGRTFVYLLTGKHPTEFEEDSLTKRLMWRESTLPDICEQLKDLIDDLMAPSPQKRPKNAEVILKRLLSQSPPIGQRLGERTGRNRNRIIQWLLLSIPFISLISLWGFTIVRNLVTQHFSINNTICYVNFSGEVGPPVGVNLHLDRRLAAGTSELVPYNTTLNFDGWAYGENVNDMWTENPDALWYRLSGRNLWVPSAKIKGYPPPGNVPLLPTNKSSLSSCFKIPKILANHWKGEYFRNHRDLEGNSVFPVFVEDLGDGSQGFSADWRGGAPSSNTPPDNFSAQIATMRYLAPGNYLVKAKADDGIRVWINEKLLIDKSEKAFESFYCNYYHSNFIVVSSYTHADFQKGKTYRARIRVADGFQLLAKHHSLSDSDPNKWVYFTPKNQWQYTYGAYKEIMFTVPNDGKYDFHFFLYKGSGNAYIDLFWEEITPSKLNS